MPNADLPPTSHEHLNRRLKPCSSVRSLVLAYMEFVFGRSWMEDCFCMLRCARSIPAFA